MKRFVLIGIFSVVVAVVIAGGYTAFTMRSRPSAAGAARPRPAPSGVSARDRLEAELKQAGKLLLQADYKVPAEAVGRSICFTPATLADFELYLKDPNPDGAGFVFVGGDGRLHDESGAAAPALTLTRSGELLFTHDGLWLFLDGVPYRRQLAGWSVYWAAPAAGTPELQSVVHARHEMSDGFMRTELLGDEIDWHMTEGEWALKQHGGGMPTSDAEMESYNFQRAVNPFSVLGTGVLTYGRDDWLDARAEARFYFGVPWDGGPVNTGTLPLQQNLMVAFGHADDRLVAFGWCGREGAFILAARESAGQWQELGRWRGSRPPISNWVRIGLQVRNGFKAEGYLDGDKVLEKELDRRVSGPFHIVGGVQKCEFDDVAAWTLPKAEDRGEPVYVKSRTFAGKKLKGTADSAQFTEWAQGADTFLKMIQRTDKYKKAIIINRLPLMGDFCYETVPDDPDVGELPMGLYELSVYANPKGGEPVLTDLQELAYLELVRDEDGWQVPGDFLSSQGLEGPLFTLRLERRAADGNNIDLLVGDRRIPLVPHAEQPIYLAITRVLPLDGRAIFPEPEHHQIYSRNLVNEFFEQGPSEWNWVEGGFRMDCRWACQDRWNFMACGGVGKPMMVSKNGYHGDQIHEYFFSLRPMFPSDAGDDAFVYDQRQHRQYFGPNNGWYVRRDLNFSFCTDGRNPLSGYSVIFGGTDNAETLLMRRDQIVARTRSYRLPDNLNVGTVHWKWWDFQVAKEGNRIAVRLARTLIFDYIDPEPLDGGHLAFWTVRNGFTLSRVTSVAQRIRREAQVLYVPDDTAPPIWRPLVHDAVCMTRREGAANTLVTANVGGGFFAVRHTPPEPVNLKEKPIMELPIEIGPDTKVNLHLQVDDKAYLIAMTAPLSDCKVLLAEEFEKRVTDFDEPMSQALLQKIEAFRIPTMSEASVKAGRLLATAVGGDQIHVNLEDLLRSRGHQGEFLLKSLTVGNSSNAGYLLAGSTGNQAGAFYAVGTPKFSPAQP